MHRTILAGILGSSLATLLYAAPVAAHISLEKGGTHVSRYGDGSLKEGPCGMAGGVRGTHIYTYEPGSTITVSIVEFVTHPSYFRLAFDNDGDDGFKEPASINPIDQNRTCPIDVGDHCGKGVAFSDFYNTPAVLAGMDNLNPHLAGSGHPKFTWQVTLPNVECTNCTLQVIQVMQDNLFHGDYDPTPGVGVEDIYHQCIDLVLKHGAPVGDGGPTGGDDAGPADPDAGPITDDAGEPGETPDGGGGGPGAGGGSVKDAGRAAAAPGQSGGCAVSKTTAAAGGVTSSASFLVGLALLGSRRRRRLTA